MPTTVDGMPPLGEWAPPPKTCVDAVQDEIYAWCAQREIEPIKLLEPERWRLTNVLAMWGATNGG